MRHVVAAVWRDGRFGWRALTRRRGFTVATVATLALGIGGATAIFSVVHAVLLQPLPYPEADRLVEFRLHATTPVGAQTFDALPAEVALDWQDTTTTTLPALSLYTTRALTLTMPGGPYRLHGAAATPGLFAMLGVPPRLGHGLAGSIASGDDADRGAQPRRLAPVSGRAARTPLAPP